MAAVNPETRLISGSEVKAWQNCRKRWWYEYRLGVIPKKLSDGLFKGIIGHEALSVFYRALMHNKSVEEATLLMNLRMGEETAKNVRLMTEGLVHPKTMSERVVLITKVAGILSNYAEHYGERDNEQYEVVEVEHMHVSDNFMAMRLDLLLRERSSGKLVLMDHKFLGDFYENAQLIANTQLPLYMRTVIGGRWEEISHGVLNEVKTKRTKKDDDEGIPDFERAVIPYIEQVATSLAEDQAVVTDEIRDNYRLPFEKSRKAALRSLSDYTCKFCPFKKPCLECDLRGDEVGMKAIINAEYEENAYGYNK